MNKHPSKEEIIQKLDLTICDNCSKSVKNFKKWMDWKLCMKCYNEFTDEIKTSDKGEIKIKCPYCTNEFVTPRTWTGEVKTQKTTSTTGNIARGAVFLPWGIVSAVKNKRFIKCPYCDMKIMQG